MRVFFFLLSVFLAQFAFGQRYLTQGNGDTLLVLEEGKARAASTGNILYSYSETAIYSGDSESGEDLQFRLKVKDVLGKSRDFMINPEGDKIWTVRNGTFFIGDSYGYNEEEVLGWLYPTDSGFLYINGLDTTVMGQILGLNWQAAEIMLGFELFKTSNRLEAHWREANPEVAKPLLPEGVIGAIFPEYGKGSVNEWWWDGDLFYPRFVQRDGGFIEWTFDGQNLQPRFGGEVVDRYVWDGNNFEPLWDREGRDEWSWDGEQLEQSWLSGTNFYMIVENSPNAPDSETLKNARIRPIYEGQEFESYIVVGEMPVPLALLKILGLSYR